MLIVHPDHDRRIDLPGVGPCPRPVDIDQSITSFDQLVSLRVYAFEKGMVIDGEAEKDEVFVTLMRGRAEITVGDKGEQVGSVALDTDVGPRVVYMPPHASYRLTATEACDIAYARVGSTELDLPIARAFTAADAVRLDGYASGMDLRLATLCAGERLGDPDVAAERFVHVRADASGAVEVGGDRLDDWDSAALSAGEAFSLEAQNGSADVLIITATRHADETSQGAGDQSR